MSLLTRPSALKAILATGIILRDEQRSKTTAWLVKYERKVQRRPHKYCLEQGIHCFPPVLGVAPVISAPVCALGKLLPLTCGCFLFVFFLSQTTTLFTTAHSSCSVCSLCTYTETYTFFSPSQYFNAEG